MLRFTLILGWVQKRWDGGEEIKEYTKWSDFISPYNDSDIKWADAADEEDENKDEPIMLERSLNPLAVLYGKGVSEKRFLMECENGFAKIRKEDFMGNDHSRIFAQIPTWADLFELRKIFAIFSKSVSYPILEYSLDSRRKVGSFFVSYAPGSDGAIIAKLMLFNYQYTNGGRTVGIMSFLSKKGVYDSCMNRGRDCNLAVSVKSDSRRMTGIPDVHFRGKLTTVKEKGQRNGSQSAQWHPKQPDFTKEPKRYSQTPPSKQNDQQSSHKQFCQTPPAKQQYRSQQHQSQQHQSQQHQQQRPQQQRPQQQRPQQQRPQQQRPQQQRPQQQRPQQQRPQQQRPQQQRPQQQQRTIEDEDLLTLSSFWKK